MSPYLLGGLGLGAVLIAVYLLRERRGQPNLSTAAGLLVSGAGISTGIKVMAVIATVNRLPSGFGEEDRAPIVIGGGAVIWIAVEAIIRALRRENDS